MTPGDITIADYRRLVEHVQRLRVCRSPLATEAQAQLDAYGRRLAQLLDLGSAELERRRAIDERDGQARAAAPREGRIRNPDVRQENNETGRRVQWVR